MLLLHAALTMTMLTTPILDEAEEKAFAERAAFIIRQTATRDTDAMIEWFDQVDYFKGAGGDRHKYILPPILARLSLDPTDEKALRAYRMLMEVDKQKGDRGLYHFAAFQRARLYAMLRDRLPADIVESNEYDVRHFSHIMDRGGTENHAFMHRCSGYIFAELVEGEYPGRLSRDEALAKQRTWLIEQARRFYHVGSGEYDSSTYFGFSMASWSNVYDYTRDEQMKLTARAALDWLAVATARKHFHGLNLGPEARGFATTAVGHVEGEPRDAGARHLKYSAVGTHTDWCAWLWFGNSAGNVLIDRTDVEVNRYPVQILAFSDYRPHPIITNLARKQVALPYEARGSKPQYYGSHNSGGNKDQEYLYISDQFAMATLYSPEDGIRTTGTILPQTSMFKAALLDEGGVRVFGMANGYHRHFPVEGRTPYDQYHQKKGAAINICYVNRDEDERTRHRSILGVPPGVGEPVVKDGWYFWQVNRAYLAARPLGAAPRFDSVGEQYDRTGYRWLVSPGALGGWIVQMGQQPQYPTLQDFQTAVLERCQVDISRFNEHREVVYRSLEGHTLKMRHTGGPGGRPNIWTDGEAIGYDDWPVFESPYVRQEAGSGVLTVTDGKRKLTINFSGDRPRYIEE
jgi:hypothetical protein